MLLFAAMVVANVAAIAQNAKITINDFSAKGGDIVELSFNLENDMAVGAFVMTMKLPDNLTFYYDGTLSELKKKCYQITDRLTSIDANLKGSFTEDLKSSNVVFYDGDGEEGDGIVPGTGAIFKFKVKVADNAAPGKYSLGFEEVSVSDLTGNVAFNVTCNTPVMTISAPTFTIGTSAVNGSVAVTPQSDGNVYEQGTEITLTATPNEGYEFTGWSNGSKENPLKVTVKADASYTASFAARKFKLTFNVDGKETTTEVAYGSPVTAPSATPTKTGYTFAGWDLQIPSTMPAQDLTFNARWTVNSYKLTFDLGEDTSVSQVNYGAAIEKPKDPTRTGYTFAGWDTEIPATMPAQDLTIKAKWTVNKYQLTFSVDGKENTTEVAYGASIQKPANPTKTGYTFAGWDAEIPSTMPDKDLTFTARWTINSYTLTYDLGDDTSVSQLDYGATIKTPKDPTRTGYTFAGWDTEIPSTMPAGDLTIKANWTVNVYKVTFVVDGEETTKEVAYGMSIESPAVSDKTGYTFTGWTPAVPSTMPAGDLTFTAQWSINSYWLTYDLGDESSYSKLSYGAAIETPQDPTRTGYTFAGWDTEIPSTMPAGNLTITALWTINSYQLTFVVDGEETSSVVEYGSTIQIPAVSDKTGYTFIGWDSAIPSTMPAGDLLFTAQWMINSYKLTFVTVEGIATTEELDFGATVTVPEDPTRTGYTFAGWDNEIPSTMPAGDLTITAQWTVNSYKLTFIIDGEETTMDVAYGETIIAPELPAKEGYAFSGWNAQIPATMPAGDLTFEAVWAVRGYNITYIVDGVETTTELAYGTIITAPADPEKTGYTFAGWDAEIPATMPDEDLTFTAQWTINVYKVNFVVDGQSTSTDVTYQAGITVPVNPEKTGYTFAGWDAEIPAAMPAEDLTFTATWKINSYQVTFMNGEEVVMSAMMEYNSEIATPQAPEKEGYTFAGWTPEVDAVVPAQDVTYEAQWTVNTYKVSYYYGDELLYEEEVEYGAAMPEYTWTPEQENITFNGWQGETCETMPAHDVVYHADFTDGIITIAQAVKRGTVYTLKGVPVKAGNLRPGIYIVNGKKVAVK